MENGERERGFYEETQLFYNDVSVVVDGTGLATTRVILPIRTKKRSSLVFVFGKEKAS